MDRSGRLDALDQRIIAKLRAAPRIQNRALAEAVGVSAPTLYARLRALEAAKVCEVRAQRDFGAMGYQRLAFVDVTVSGRAVRDVAVDIAAIDATLAVLEFVEEPRLSIPVVAADDTDLRELVTHQIGGIAGIMRLATYPALHTHRYAQEFGEIQADRHLPLPSIPAQIQTDEVDELILEALRLDARLSNRAIATQLGLSEPNVRRRISSLCQRKVLTFTLVTSPAALGLTAWGYIRLAYPPRLARDIVEYMKTSAECVSISEAAGQWNLHCWALFKDDSHLTTFSDNIGGLFNHDATFSVRKIHHVEKHNCDYMKIV